MVERSWQVAERLDRALPEPLLDVEEPPLATAVAIVSAAREHLKFAEAMEACTLLSAARGELRRLPVSAAGRDEGTGDSAPFRPG